MLPSSKDFRSAVLGPLLAQNAVQKAELTLALQADLPLNCQAVIADPGGIPGRPLNPELVSHTSLKAKPLNTTEGRALLLHAIAHIELNAIDLALDVVWRFDSMPEDFYRDWVRIAKEEAKHFLLIHKHLRGMGFDYGDFPAHNSLWEMAERTRGDLVARIGLVPRTMEARGLDASPGVKNKLISAGDHAAGARPEGVGKGHQGPARSGAVFHHVFRRAGRGRFMGVALRGPSFVVQLHGGRREARFLHALLHGDESGGGTPGTAARRARARPQR